MLLPAGRLAAQDEPGRVVATLKGLHTGVCVEFLVAPTAVREQFGGAVRPAAIESLATKYPVLARVAREEGAYQGWAPAQYCWYLYREGEFGGRPFRQANGLQPVAVGYLSVASTGLPEGIDQVVVTYFTNSDRLAGILSGARLRVDEIDLTLGLIPEEETALSRRRYTAKHGRTTVQWDGGPGAARPVEIRTLGLLGRTIGGSAHRIEATITPDSVFASSGTLKVSGTGELQRLLAASPIRLVASFLRGGDTDWSFGR